MVSYDERPAITDTKEASDPDAPKVWQDHPDNRAFVVERGDKAATDKAFDGAAHVTALDLRITRVTATSIEPRSAIGTYDDSTGTYVLRTGTQTPHRQRNILAQDILRISPERLRVVSPDIGGAFGMKNNPYPETALVLWAAKRVGRPVAWQSSRIEAMQSDYQGRDNHVHGELALDGDGRMLAVRIKSIGNLGAYLGPLSPHPPTANIGGVSGPTISPRRMRISPVCIPQRLPHLRSGDRSGYGCDLARPLRCGRRRGHGDQSNDRQRSDARRYRPRGGAGPDGTDRV